MVITFTLQAAYSGATYVAGPFDISGTTSGGVTTLLGDNISKASLLTGVTISNINDATTGGTIQSVDGVCSNSVSWLSSNYPAEGTLLETVCDGTTLNSIYADGSGGTYIVPTLDSTNCGGGGPTTYFCRTGEFGQCLEQAAPCGEGQFNCGGGPIQ